MNIFPKISVIMSVYNGEMYLEETLESICNQTFSDWELVVINDCSTDSTAGILSKYAQADSRIKVHTNEVNLRLQKSLNKALDLASGKYIARMDADDICFPERLEKQYEFMENNPDICLSSCRFLTLKNGVYSSGGGGSRCDDNALRALLFVTNPILHPGVIARAEVIKPLGYDVRFTCSEDLELWTRLEMKKYKIEILPEYLMIYRLHDKQISSTTLEKQCMEVKEIQKQYYGTFLECMSKEKEEFYINSIYFRNNINSSGFIEFCKWIKSVNKKKKAVPHTDLLYALFEIFAEYKRTGISHFDFARILLCFNPVFLIKEFKSRKIRAYNDGIKCIAAAKKLGLSHSFGPIEYPSFSKLKDKEQMNADV